MLLMVLVGGEKDMYDASLGGPGLKLAPPYITESIPLKVLPYIAGVIFLSYAEPYIVDELPWYADPYLGDDSFPLYISLNGGLGG